VSQYKPNLTLEKFYSAISNRHNVWESNINSGYTHYKFISPDDEDTFKNNLEKNYKRLLDNNWLDSNNNIVDIDYRINKQGFRCDHFSDEEGILFLGCSFTFGVGLHEHQTWAYKVAEHFGVKCWNLGIPGHGLDLHSYFLQYHLKSELPNIKAICVLEPPPDRISLIYEHDNELALLDYFTLIHANTQDQKTWTHRDFLHSLELTYIMNNLKNLKIIEDYCLKENIKYVNFNSMTISFKKGFDSRFIRKGMNKDTYEKSFARDCQHHGESENTFIANQVIEKLDK